MFNVEIILDFIRFSKTNPMAIYNHWFIINDKEKAKEYFLKDYILYCCFLDENNNVVNNKGGLIRINYKESKKNKEKLIKMIEECSMIGIYDDFKLDESLFWYLRDIYPLEHEKFDLLINQFKEMDSRTLYGDFLNLANYCINSFTMNMRNRS